VGTTQTKELITQRFELLRKQQSTTSTKDIGTSGDIQIFDIKKYEDALESPLVKPSSPSWDELVILLQDVVNMPGFLETRIKYLYEQGYGAELVTAAEIARTTAYKSPQALFTRSTSKSEDNWEKRTLAVVKKTWEARRITLEVIDKLGLTDPKQTRLILFLAHKLRSRLLQYLSMATKGEGRVKNPRGLFFALAYKAAHT
jgi:hypothetical protein